MSSFGSVLNQAFSDQWGQVLAPREMAKSNVNAIISSPASEFQQYLVLLSQQHLSQIDMSSQGMKGNERALGVGFLPAGGASASTHAEEYLLDNWDNPDHLPELSSNDQRMLSMLDAGHAGKDHHVTYQEARWWWKNGGGETLIVDGRALGTIEVGGRLMVSPFPFLDDLKVHGHVSINPGNGRIYDGYYDFEPRTMANPNNNPLIAIRNSLNLQAIEEHGAGTPFEIEYRYEDKYFR